MCGFVGGILRRGVEDSDVRAFTRAVRLLAHRGPDDERLLVLPEARAVLAFRRLSIIDRAGGAQPMSIGGQHLVFNGEIYNHADIRAALSARGVAFHTHSDTEVLLQSLRTDGQEALESTKGMFALAFLDVPGDELLLARDRLGVKQLYYIEGTAGFFFASEPKALLALSGVQAEFDASRLGAYFTFRCVPSPHTLFRGIRRLQPGETLRVSLASSLRRLQRFWEYPAPVTRPAERVPIGDAVDALELALLKAVERRLVADVPVGAFLSGGLDSSLVVAAMRRLKHRDLQTYTAVFPGSPDDEAQFARRVSERFGTRHSETAVDAEQCLTALPRWIELNDDLVADASSIPLLLVSDAARAAGCLVMLAGEGADELFGGYGAHHKYIVLHRLANALPSQSARAAVLRGFERAGLVGAADVPRVREYFVRRGAYLGAGALAAESELRSLLEDEVLCGFEDKRATGHRLDDLCRFDFTARIADDLLVRTDRATMGASIEARVPFLDHDLIALVNRLPSASRMLLGVSKTAPRLLARRWGVPVQTIVHRKIGFQLPLGAWFRGPLRRFWDQVLRERAIPGIRYEEVARLVDAHVATTGSNEEMLWRIAALEAWHRRWIRNEVFSLSTIPPRIRDAQSTPALVP